MTARSEGIDPRGALAALIRLRDAERLSTPEWIRAAAGGKGATELIDPAALVTEEAVEAAYEAGSQNLPYMDEWGFEHIRKAIQGAIDHALSRR
jgi:hypothetical protein